jgi:Flp pilus assembly protein TadB
VTAGASFSDATAAALAGGLPPAAAVVAAADWIDHPVGVHVRRCADALRHGAPFDDAMHRLRHEGGPALHAAIDALLSAARDGLPVASVMQRLADEARDERRRFTEAAIRTLPVRLALPLVCCILPSFILLGVVPLAIDSLSTIAGGAP